MRILKKIFGYDAGMPSKPAEMDNDSPGYFLASASYVEQKGSRAGFHERGRVRGELERSINDDMLASDNPLFECYLVQRKSNGAEVIHAEFLAQIHEGGVIVGPVAIAPRANHAMVREKRLVLLARISLHPDVRKGDCFVISVPNTWGEQRVLQELGFSTDANIPIATKARLLDLTDGRDGAVFAVQVGKTVPANACPSKATGAAWRIRIGGEFDIGAARITLEAERDIGGQRDAGKRFGHSNEDEAA